jgi:outer membrane protein OmpA-like peptidoglycan-associated protein
MRRGIDFDGLDGLLAPRSASRARTMSVARARRHRPSRAPFVAGALVAAFGAAAWLGALQFHSTREDVVAGLAAPATTAAVPPPPRMEPVVVVEPPAPPPVVVEPPAPPPVVARAAPPPVVAEEPFTAHFPATYYAGARWPMRKRLDEVDALVATLQSCRGPIEVTGHTCGVGPASVNEALALLRARNIERVLKARGLQDRTFVVRGFGSEHPVADNDVLRGRLQNRRVEVSCLLDARAPWNANRPAHLEESDAADQL